MLPLGGAGPARVTAPHYGHVHGWNGAADDRLRPRLDGRLRVTVASESARFHDALRGADLTARIPSCPDWDGATLAWRLAAIDRRSPTDTCWSWHAEGHSVAWVRRRQAHEALIHRVDGELLAGLPVTDVDPSTAADGVDEFIASMFGSPLPAWARFVPDGEAIALETTDIDARWTLELGRFAGTSPVSGTTYDEEDARPRLEPGPVGATVRGTAWDLDRCLGAGAGPSRPGRRRRLDKSICQ